MSGGYISCGLYSGDDKSGSAFQGIVPQIESLPSYRPSAELRQYFARVKAFLSGERELEWSDYLLIPSQHAAELRPYLEECKRVLIAELGTSDPFDAISKDDVVSGLDPVEAKWGKGRGWRLYCAADLLRAVDQSRVSGEDICIAFD